jgi:hypothetical protein
MTTPRVACPTCGKSVPWTTESTWRPFCSQRCRFIDLGEWLDESRRIPEVAATADSDVLVEQAPQDWEVEPSERYPRRPN